MSTEGAVRKAEKSRSEKLPHGSILNLTVNPSQGLTGRKSLSQKSIP